MKTVIIALIIVAGLLMMYVTMSEHIEKNIVLPSQTMTPSLPPSIIVVSTPIPVVITPQPTPTNYTIATMKYSNGSNFDVIVELSYNCTRITLSCPGYRNSTIPLLITPKNVTLFQFTNTTCSGDKGYIEYILPNSRTKNISMLLRSELVSFRLNFTD